ncbi:MAG: sulfite exporter TauE/SafE family protein [Bacteroidetes bacterium]|nr:sulfite exporter TauE/SafE family protein [Bacteroidota bacterium]
MTEFFGYIASVLIGITLGLIGSGGSILTVPVMVYLFAVSPQLATSYSLFVVGTTSVAGIISRLNTNAIKPRVAFLFATTSVITVFVIRKFVIPLIPAVLFNIGNFSVTESMATMVLFAILMLLSATSMIRNSKKEALTAVMANNTKLALYGIGIGLVTGFLGAGGGFLIIPALVLLCGLNMKEAVGTSLLIIASNSLIGFIGDYGHFITDWKLLLSVTALAVTGIIIGTQLAKRINNTSLKKGFGWFVLAMGIYIIAKELFFK